MHIPVQINNKPPQLSTKEGTSNNMHDEQEENNKLFDISRPQYNFHNFSQADNSYKNGNGKTQQLPYSFSYITVHPGTFIQPKLSINAPGDEYEQEADTMAEKVMRMPEIASTDVITRSVNPLQNKIETTDKDEPEEEKKEYKEEEGGITGSSIQRKIIASDEEEKNELSETANVQEVIQSSGEPLDKATRTFMERRFGFDFGKVQIHNNAVAHQSAKDINALAYTHKHHIAFGAGQYQPQTGRGKKLLAHELVHVLQQGNDSFIQRKASISEDEVKKTAPSPDPERVVEEISSAETSIEGGATAKFIVEDNRQPGEGQMQKTVFINVLNEAICQTVENALQGTKYSSDNCPYIRAVFEKYKDGSAFTIEQLIDRYAHVLDSAKTATDLISLVQVRVRSYVQMWLKTGNMEGVPDDIKSKINAGMNPAAKNAVKEGNAGSIQFKAKNGSTNSNNKSPLAVMQSLGKGKPLEGRTRSKMENAFNTDFGNVEIHHDGNAANIASNMNARAFAVGNHIAFGSGEHKPGTLLGDALLAHELAHVEQQKGATEVNLINENEEQDAEQEADHAAMKVMFKTYGKKGKRNTSSFNLKRGLSLQKCDYGPDFSELSMEEKQAIREEILSETELVYDPDPEKVDVYAGLTMSISLDAPAIVSEGYREYPYIQSLSFEFPDGRIDQRQVYPGGNQFMSVGEGLHKISGTIMYLPDMAPAKFEKRINVVKLKTLTDKVSQEDMNANKRGDTLFSELLAFQNLSGSLREKALSAGLSENLLLKWYEANAQAILVEGLLKEKKTIDASAHSTLMNKFTAFSNELRKAVAGFDYESTEDVYVGEGQTEEMKVTKNQFFSPGNLEYFNSIISYETVGISVKISMFLNLTQTFDLYIEDLFKKSGDAESGKTLKAAGKTENALRSLYIKQGNLQPVKAIFYPTEQSNLEGGVKQGDGIPENYRAKKYDLRFYTYKTVDGSTVTWHLIDATNPENVMETEEDGDSKVTPPDSLFTELDNASRFPTGVLYWQLPGQGMRSHDIVHPLTFTQFLTYLGIGLAVLGITLATAGAGTAATVLFVASGIAGAAGAVADMVEKDNVGALTTKDIVFDVLTFVTSLLSAGTAAAGRVIATGVGATGNYARLAVGLDKIYKPLAGVALAADMISLGVFTVDFAAQINAVIDSTQLTGDAKKEALTRLIFQGLITGGLTLLAVKGSIADFKKGRSLYMDLTPAGPKARFILPDTTLLGSALTAAKKAELEALFKKLDTPANQAQLFQLKAEISAAMESGVVKQSEISSFIDDLTASSGDIAKIEKRIAEFRAKNMEAVKADFESFKQKAKSSGLTDKQAELSYDTSKSASKEDPRQIVDKSKTLDQQLDQLYEQAKVADAELKGIVTRISGETGGTAGFRPGEVNNGLKGRERAMEKLNNDYKDPVTQIVDASKLIDISGAQITFNKLDDMYNALKKFTGEVNIVQFKDNIVKKYASGYGDIKLSLKMSNGHVVELKLLLKEVEEISSREHVLYEKIRSKIPLTAAEQAQFDAFRSEYAAAFDNAVKQNK